MNFKIVVVIIIPLIFAVIPNYIYAAQDDIELAKKFISELPPACKGSQYSVLSDGTVIIRILCIGLSPEKLVDGEIRIKDGIVTKVR